MIKPPLPAASTAPAPGSLVPRLRHLVRALRALHNRERSRMRSEIAQLPVFLGLLLKPGLGGRLTPAERRALQVRWHGMGRLGLYLTSMVVPGTTFTLPLLAWWLDRRDERRARQSIPISGASPSG